MRHVTRIETRSVVVFDVRCFDDLPKSNNFVSARFADDTYLSLPGNSLSDLKS